MQILRTLLYSAVGDREAPAIHTHMNFYETKDGQGFRYEMEDLIGRIVITSDRQLDAKHLDTITVAVMQSRLPEGEITPGITFTFERAEDWIEDDQEEDTSLSNNQNGDH